MSDPAVVLETGVQNLAGQGFYESIGMTRIAIQFTLALPAARTR